MDAIPHQAAKYWHAQQQNRSIGLCSRILLFDRVATVAQLVSTYAPATQVIPPNNKCEGVIFIVLCKTVCGAVSTDSGKYLSLRMLFYTLPRHETIMEAETKTILSAPDAPTGGT